MVKKGNGCAPSPTTAYYHMYWVLELKDLLGEVWEGLSEEEKAKLSKIKWQNEQVRALLRDETEEVKEKVQAYIDNWQKNPLDHIPASILADLHEKVQKAIWQQK